jgi:ADP-heptose:LPS heptosyltransferase
VKSPLIIINRDERIGDALLCQPVIAELAKQFEDVSDVYLAMTNRDVMRICAWPENVKDITSMEPPFTWAQADVVVLGVYAAIGGAFKTTVMHPIQALFALAGLDVPPLPPQPELKPINIQAEAFDYLIAPWSKDAVRGLSADALKDLVRHLNPEENKIGILGGSTDEILPDIQARWIYGESLERVIAEMRACRKAVITTDSAANRLAHAACIPNQVILAGDNGQTPIQWIVNQRCTAVWAKPGQWRVSDIFTAIENARAQKAAA